MTLGEQTSIGKVVLNVSNLENMKKFYSVILGMEILSETDTEVTFGAKGTPEELLTIRKTDQEGKQQKSSGLYHFALLVPERSDLGTILLHLLQIEYPLTGASDHGYSEAIYLNDPEGNGIEIYRDKSVSKWDIRDNGDIAGVTIQMDTEGVLQAARREYDGMPAGTVMGHVHLFVGDLEKSEDFYKNVLGFDLKYNFGRQAKFFAAGLYHHHIGTNTWGGSDLEKPQSGDLGMEYFTILVPDEEELDQVEERLAQSQADSLKRVSSELVTVKDPNGIAVYIQVKP